MGQALGEWMDAIHIMLRKYGHIHPLIELHVQQRHNKPMTQKA